MVDVLPPVGAYPKWEVNGTATEGYITISVMQSGGIFVKQEMKSGAKTLLKTLQAISNTVSVKEEPMDENDPDSANHSTTKPSTATSSTDGKRKSRADKTVLCSIKILLAKSPRGRKKKDPDPDLESFPIAPIMIVPNLEEESGSTPSPEDAQQPLKMKVFDVEAYKKSVIPIELQRKKMASEVKVKPDASAADTGNNFSEDDNDNASGSLSNISIKKEPEDADVAPDNEHVTQQKMGFNPKICPRTLRVQEDLPPQQCQICKKTFHNIYLLQIHLDNNHFQCDICKRILERHQLIWHKKYQVECTECKKVFCTRADQYNHWSEKHGKFYKCDACNATFETEALYENHREQSYVCEICSEVFCTKYKYQKHYSTHVLTCPQCPCSFHNQKLLDRHMERHNYMECDVCGKKMKGRANLKLHKDQVHSVTFTPCDVCGKLYKGIKSLEQHKITMHGAEGRYKCDVCGKQYLEKPKYEQHMRIHTGEKPYQCTICGKAFMLSGSLYVHTKKHDANSYSCTICGATYQNKYYLRTHMNRHDPTKAVTCKICLKTFRAKALLRIHSEIHKNERRHKCEICGTAYNNAGSLWTHKKKHRDRNEMPSSDVQ